MDRLIIKMTVTRGDEQELIDIAYSMPYKYPLNVHDMYQRMINDVIEQYDKEYAEVAE